jgi:signal transduction histidine kinase
VRRSPNAESGRLSPYRTIVPIIIIAIVAVGLSIASYQYSAAVSAQITAAATEDLKENGRIQAFDLSKSIENRLVSVRNNLQMLANAPSVQAGDYAQGRTLVDAAQMTTAGLTDSYFWIDETGKLQWANSFADPEIYNQYYGIDRSDRPYFAAVQESHRPYFSTLIESIDNVPRIYIAYPVMSGDSFKGIVASSINLDTLGNQINAQLPPESQNSASLMDRDGTVLFAQTKELLGKNYLSEEVQTLVFTNFIHAEEKDSFNAILRDSLAGNSGIGEFTSSGTPFIIAYNPVTVSGIDGNASPEHVMSLLVIIPKTFATNIMLLIEQQRTFSTLVPAIIGAVAAAVALMVIRSNTTLEKTVRERTSEFKTSNEMLAKANKELEAANEQLKANENMQREFINIAAHELRTPIQPLIGVAEMLENQFRAEGKDEIPIRKAELELLTRNARRLLRLSSDLLEVSRIESGTMRLSKDAVDLKEKIKSIMNDVRKVLPEKNRVSLRSEFKTDAPVIVDADRERLFEVLYNLLNNAIKFTSSGEVVVSLEEKDGQAVVSVRDSGSGIAPEIFPKLFTKFATNSDQGTGLGLFIVKNIVEAHGGRVWAGNNAGGRGATFTFTLPALEQK